MLKNRPIHFHINTLLLDQSNETSWNFLVLKSTSHFLPHLEPLEDAYYWEKRKNKTKYLTWNSIRPKFGKKTSMSNSVDESLGYVNCYSSSSPRPVIKSSNNSVRYNCQKICICLRRPKTILEIRKKARFQICLT